MKHKIIYLSIIILSSCNIKYYQTDKGFWRPSDEGVFTYQTMNFQLDSSIVDTTKIYCNAYPIDKPKYFDCYRFFSDGRLLKYRFLNKIDTTSFADINMGGVGYYHVKNNVIRTQEFTVYAEHFKEGGGGKLIHFYGIITKDTITIDPERKTSKKYYFKPKFGKRTYYLKYEKTDIEAPPLTD